jgi:hypothetical protein
MAAAAKNPAYGKVEPCAARGMAFNFIRARGREWIVSSA